MLSFVYLLVVCPFNMKCLVKNVCSYHDHHFYQIVPPMVHIKYTMSASSKTNNIIAFYYLCSRYNMSNVICLLLQCNTTHVSLTIMRRRCKPSPPFLKKVFKSHHKWTCKMCKGNKLFFSIKVFTMKFYVFKDFEFFK